MSQESRKNSLTQQTGSYLPPLHGKASAWVCGSEEAEVLYKQALENPEEFWAGRASQLLHWFKRWDKVLEADEERHTATFSLVAATRQPSSGRAKTKWTCAASPTRCSTQRSAV